MSVPFLRSLWLLFLLLLSACATPGASSSGPVPETAPAPAPAGSFTLDLDTHDGGRFSFESIRGKRHLLISFWATWCDPCKAELRELAALYPRYRDKVEFVAVSTDGAENMDRVRTFAVEQAIPFPVLVDPSKRQTPSLLPGGDTVPFSMLVRSDGTVVSTHTGFEPGDEERIVQEIDQLLAQ